MGAMIMLINSYSGVDNGLYLMCQPSGDVVFMTPYGGMTIDTNGDVRINGHFFDTDGQVGGGSGGFFPGPWTGNVNAGSFGLINLATIASPTGVPLTLGTVSAGNIDISGALTVAGVPITGNPTGGPPFGYVEFKNTGGATTVVVDPDTSTISVGAGANAISISPGQILVGNKLNGAAVQVRGSVDITGSYLINGLPIGADPGSGPAVDVSPTAPATPVEGTLWFDQVNLRLVMRFGGQWLEIVSFTPIGPGTSTWDGGLTVWDGGDTNWDIGLHLNAPGEVWDRTLRRN
jgi:hypothetical protein